MNTRSKIINTFVLFSAISISITATQNTSLYFNNKRFYNYEGENTQIHRLDCLKIFFKSRLSFTPSPKKETLELWKATPSIKETEEKPTITWIGHATFLIQMKHINIITDPTFYDLSLFHNRISKPGISPKDLPKIHVILISHNHRDHLDEKSLKELVHDNPTVLVPKGDAPLLKKIGFNDVHEFLWWESKKHKLSSSKSISFSFLPAKHWSSRGLMDLNMSAWGSWMIGSKEHHIYFAGDSAYNTSHYKSIAERYPSIDVALMPIAPNSPQSNNKTTHMSAEESIKAFQDLKAKTFIPMHWGTYPLGTDRFEEPIMLLQHWWKEQELALQKNHLSILRFGETYKENA
jgi:L-ascorbate metabolism protein UlaG (beta-lactamase superfamily)